MDTPDTTSKKDDPLTDAQVDAWLEAHKNDPVDPERANRIEWLFRKKLAASVIEKSKEWLRHYDDRIAQGGKGAQDMKQLYGEEAAFRRDVIRAVETLALEPPTVSAEHVDFVFDNTPCCKVCGLVRPAEGWTRPCKGPSKLSLRAALALADAPTTRNRK